jgi:hypothetical protein
MAAIHIPSLSPPHASPITDSQQSRPFPVHPGSRQCIVVLNTLRYPYPSHVAPVVLQPQPLPVPVPSTQPNILDTMTRPSHTIPTTQVPICCCVARSCRSTWKHRRRIHGTLHRAVLRLVHRPTKDGPCLTDCDACRCCWLC